MFRDIVTIMLVLCLVVVGISCCVLLILLIIDAIRDIFQEKKGE